MKASRLAGLALLAVSLAGWWVDRPLFFAAWLAAWWWCLGIVLGAFVNAWMQRLSGGAWGRAVQPVAAMLGPRLPWVLLLFVPLLAGLPALYPWVGNADAATAGLARPAFARAWFDPRFFAVRLAGYALVWWWLARAGSRRSAGRSAASLLVYTIVTSLAAFDLMMSLMPRWYSTGFGLVVLSNQALAGSAFAALCAPPPGADLPPPPGDQRPPLSRDIGNLMLMWTMTWAYLAFMQFLIIWAENLPREIAWYVPRLQTGWREVGLALVGAQLAVPFLALLFRSVKDRPARLRAVAALLLASSALDVVWTVLPSVAPHSLHGWWLVPLTAGGMALLLFGGLQRGSAPAGDRDAPEASAPNEELGHASR
ncbi:MAG: hypothetical protein ACJ8G7_17415 [Rhizobacter sp.]